MSKQLSPMIAEIANAIDLSKLDKEALVLLLCETVNPDELTEIINRHNDQIIDDAMESTKQESRRWFGLVDRVGRSTVHKLIDNAVVSFFKRHWPS